MSLWIWLGFDIIFLCYFINSMAHEAGWFSVRMFSWANPYPTFGRNNTFMLILDGLFVALWIWILLDDVRDLMVTS